MTFIFLPANDFNSQLEKVDVKSRHLSNEGAWRFQEPFTRFHNMVFQALVNV